VAKAAIALNMSFRELNSQPEPGRTIMIGWGMAIHNGEARAAEENARAASHAAGISR
jgi:hypothetical protein